MKHNIFRRSGLWLAGMFIVPCSMFLASCNDDVDAPEATGNMIQKVETGTSECTANTATLHGSIEGLSSLSTSAYSVGFNYGYSEDAVVNNVAGSLEGSTVTATLTGLTEGVTLYYSVYLKMAGGTLVRKGEVKSALTSNAKAITAEGAATTEVTATLKATYNEAPADAKLGFVIAPVMLNEDNSINTEAVRSKGLKLFGANNGQLDLTGLVPNTTYAYAALIDLGAGLVYGDVCQFTTKAEGKTPEKYDAELVDLGLSTKWCSRNVGALDNTAAGGLFAFADLTGALATLDVNDFSAGANDKGEPNNSYMTEFDVAYAATQCMTLPTAEQWDELFHMCKTEWTTQDGMQGLLVTGLNVAAEGAEEVHNTIFLPAAGSRTGDEVAETELCRYATGSANSNFYIGYEFADGQPQHRTAFQRYMAVSVRPVSTFKNIPFDKAKLIGKKWKLDFSPDDPAAVAGQRFNGALWCYAPGECWGNNVENKPGLPDCGRWWDPGTTDWYLQPKMGDEKINVWGDAGYMEFKNDNTYIVKQNTVEKYTDNDGKEQLRLTEGVEESGTYEIIKEDDSHVYIKLSGHLLDYNNVDATKAFAYSGTGAEEQYSKLPIISLDDETLQICTFRDETKAGEGLCQIAHNYVAENVYKLYLTVNAGLYSSSNWSLNIGYRGLPEDPDFFDEHSVTVEGAMGNDVVLCLDAERFGDYCPDGIIWITGVEFDGKAAAFDPLKLLYGYIEGKPKMRTEIYNCWGHGTASDSPFGTETPYNFKEKVTVKFKFLKNPQHMPFFTSQVGPSWATLNGTSDKGIELQCNTAPGDTDNDKYKLTTKKPFPTTTTLTIKGAGIGGNTYFGWDGLKVLAPNAQATLTKVTVDGTDIPFEADRLINGFEGKTDNYRINLWNPWAGMKNPFNKDNPDDKGDGTFLTQLDFKQSLSITVNWNWGN